MENQREKKKKIGEWKEEAGTGFRVRRRGEVNTNWMETTKRRGDEEEEGRDSKGVREGLLGSGN